ncbi:MAG: hypothetical protein H0T39_04340 [Actinobacteria bacterium]|nr:hypothetical protein [Actinomycetota bacterium]
MSARLVAVAAAAFLAAGCSGGGDPERQGAPAPIVESPPYPTKVSVTGGSPAERKLLGAIVTAVGPRGTERIRIGWNDVEFGTYGAGELALTVTPERDGDAQSQRSRWERWLIAGAFRDRMADLGLPPDGGPQPRRRRRLLEPGVHPVRQPGPADAERQLALRIERAVASSGATLEHIRVLRPYGVAAAIRLRAYDPARFMATRLRTLLRELRLNPGASTVGLYVELADARGEIAWRLGSALRYGAGSVWTRRDLVGCNPVVGSQAVGVKVPPCPFPGG